jgi:Rps23 Pro-64 3,4-dihydroxylase Tpa1-like proline 4-hydroxylase
MLAPLVGTDLPISDYYLDNPDKLCCQFNARDPLRKFALIGDFFKSEVAERIYEFCEQSHFPQLFKYYVREDLDLPYIDAERDIDCVFAQKRIEQTPTDLSEMKATIGSPRIREFLTAATGINMTDRSDFATSLTLMGPGDRIERHDDADGGQQVVRLVVVLSLAKSWSAENGGVAKYQWSDVDHCVEVVPRFNEAVLFGPFPGATHWVTPVRRGAPRGRYALTMSFT